MASPPPPRHETSRDLKAILLTLAGVALVIGVLSSLGPSKPSTATLKTGGSTTTTTTTSPPSSPSSTTAPAGSAGKVAVLAPTGSPATAGVQQKLTAASYTLVNHAPIPSSWVTNLANPIVRYPNGLYDEAVAVARALGLDSSVVSPEPSGTSDGSDVVEVFVPAS